MPAQSRVRRDKLAFSTLGVSKERRLSEKASRAATVNQLGKRKPTEAAKKGKRSDVKARKEPSLWVAHLTSGKKKIRRIGLSGLKEHNNGRHLDWAILQANDKFREVWGVRWRSMLQQGHPRSRKGTPQAGIKPRI